MITTIGASAIGRWVVASLSAGLAAAEGEPILSPFSQCEWTGGELVDPRRTKRSGFVLALIWVFVGSISHLVAQVERIEAQIGPLSLAAMRAGAQLTREPASLPAHQVEDPHQADWSRVRALEAGTDITLTVK